MSELNDQVIVITGAGRGLGRAYALAAASAGAKVVVNDPGVSLDGSGGDPAVAESVVAEIRDLGAEAVANTRSIADVDGATSVVESAVAAFGRLDGLVNNAGILRDKTLLKMPVEAWDEVLTVHLRGSFLCCAAAARQFVAQGTGGSIVNTSSFAGLVGNYGQANYAAAKGGIYGLTRVCALELERFAIRCNAIAPLAKTRMTENVDAVAETMTLGGPAAVVLFLLSSRSKGVNGRVFGIHGERLFEYRMQSSRGVSHPAWTSAVIAERLDAITLAEGPEASATAAAAHPASGRIQKLLFSLPDAFRADRADGWRAVIQWTIQGTGSFVVRIGQDCRVEAGTVDKPDCRIITDSETFDGMALGRVDGAQAFMQGQIKASDVSVLMKYQRVFSQRKIGELYARLVAEQAEPRSASDEYLAAMSPLSRLRLWLALLPQAGKADGDAALVHLTWGDVQATVGLGTDGVHTALGHVGQATDELSCSAETFWQRLTGTGEVPGLDSSAAAGSGSVFSRLISLIDKPREVIAEEIARRGLGVRHAQVGRVFHGTPVFVQRAHVRAFAEATGQVSADGPIAMPMLSVAFFNTVFHQLFDDSEVAIDKQRLLFGEMALDFRQPVAVGDLVVAKCWLEAIEDKHNGQFLRVRSRLMNEGQVRVDGLATFFVRWAGQSRLGRLTASVTDPIASAAAIHHFEADLQTQADQAQRFADAANDHNPIHLDADFARAAGLKGVILHGLCSMSMSARALTEGPGAGQAQRLKHLAVRFAKPVYPGQSLQLRASSFEPGAYQFEVRSDSDELVITQGRALLQV